MWGLGAPGRDDKGKGFRGWETPGEGGEKPQVGFGGAARLGERRRETGHKERKALAVAGESARGEQTQVH